MGFTKRSARKALKAKKMKKNKIRLHIKKLNAKRANPDLAWEAIKVTLTPSPKKTKPRTKARTKAKSRTKRKTSR